MQLNLSTDWQCWDNTEPVVLQSMANTGSATDYVAQAVRRSVTIRDQAASGGAYQADDISYLVPATFLRLASLPKPGDMVTDRDGNTLTILSVQGMVRDGTGRYQVYKLVCRDLIIAYQLQDLINIERYVATLDSTGAELKAWNVVYRNVPARVQRITEEVNSERGIRGTGGNYQIYLSQELNVTVKDRIPWSVLGGYLEIIGYHNRQRIDELPVIDAKLAP